MYLSSLKVQQEAADFWVSNHPRLHAWVSDFSKRTQVRGACRTSLQISVFLIQVVECQSISV